MIPAKRSATDALDANVASGSYSSPMKTVGLRELKNGLSRYVQEVRLDLNRSHARLGSVYDELRPPMDR